MALDLIVVLFLIIAITVGAIIAYFVVSRIRAIPDAVKNFFLHAVGFFPVFLVTTVIVGLAIPLAIQLGCK